MKRPFAFALFAVALVVATLDSSFAPAAADDILTVEFLDVGQGDAVLIRTPDGKTALIDAGTKTGVMKHLEKRDVKSIDLLVTSHHHADHIGGSIAVVEEFQPKAYLDSGSGSTSKTYKALLQAVKESKGTKFLRPREGAERQIKLGSSVVLRVFPQPPEDEDNENNNSVGVRLQYKDFSVLLTGDSEEDERAWWTKHADKSLYSKVTVMKLAHHGSRNGTDADWLTAAKPELAVASCARGNSYRHPHRETLDLLAERKLKFMRTDEQGTIRIKTNGTTWEFDSVAEVAARDRLVPFEPANPNPRGWYSSDRATTARP